MNLTAALPAVGASFLASLVEVVEAFTIVLAVATVRGPRPALLGAVGGLVALALLVALLGPLFQFVPLRGLQIVIGLALLLFGMRWLRKAILRSAGLIALHDEEKAFLKESAALDAEAKAQAARADFLAGLAAFKAVLLEGVEVVFIVLAVGGGRGLIGAASLGALAAAALVAVVGLALRRPLSAVPENALEDDRRRDALGLRHVLDWRGPWRSVAGRGLVAAGAGDRLRSRRMARRDADSRPASSEGRRRLMAFLLSVLKELYGLFVDDGSLAIAVLGWVAICALIAAAGLAAALLGPLLFAGLAALMIENVLRRARKG